MEKFTKKDVFDYLLGNDIENIEELENNPEFMAEVVCKDKKSYNLCSDEIKSNFLFTKKVIQKYKDDIPFARMVVDKFLEVCEDKEQTFEIYIIMTEITKDLDELEKLTYYLGANMRYELDQMGVEISLEQESEQIKNLVGRGFAYYTSEYPTNKTILDYVAKQFINQIIYVDIDLEKNIHDKYESFEKFEEEGKLKKIIDYIEKYDKFLAEYVCCNIEVLDGAKKELERIRKNWFDYEYHLKCQKYSGQIYNTYEIIIDEVYEYLSENYECRISPPAILYYVASEFNVYNEIEENDFLRNAFDLKVIDEFFDFYEVKRLRKDNILPVDMPFINEVRKIFAKNLGVKYKPENGSKIVKFKGRKKID